MYLLEGTADLQHHYHLRMGDMLIFAQKPDQTIVLAGRPSTKADVLKKAPMRKPSPVPATSGGRGAGRREQVSRSAGKIGLDWYMHRWEAASIALIPSDEASVN